jgi:molecular chaperone GrpE
MSNDRANYETDPHAEIPEGQPEGQSSGPRDDGDDMLSAEDLIARDGTIHTGDDDPRDARIAELEDQMAATKDQALRALAEAENTKRRVQRENDQIKKYAAGGLAKDLMSAIDNLSRALEAAPEPEGLDDATKNLVVGVEMIGKELQAAFEKHNIRKIEPMGEKFDPNFHEAMFEVPNSGKPAGTVVQVMAPGYVLHDRLLRAAMVGVAKGGAPEDHKPVDTTA